MHYIKKKIIIIISRNHCGGAYHGKQLHKFENRYADEITGPRSDAFVRRNHMPGHVIIFYRVISAC